MRDGKSSNIVTAADPLGEQTRIEWEWQGLKRYMLYEAGEGCSLCKLVSELIVGDSVRLRGRPVVVTEVWPPTEGIVTVSWDAGGLTQRGNFPPDELAEVIGG